MVPAAPGSHVGVMWSCGCEWTVLPPESMLIHVAHMNVCGLCCVETVDYAAA